MATHDMGYKRVVLCDIFQSVPRVSLSAGLSSLAPMDKKFQHTTDMIQSSKLEMQEELSSQLENLPGQESASQEVVKKIEKHSHQFRRKGNKEQFRFNASWRILGHASKVVWPSRNFLHRLIDLST